MVFGRLSSVYFFLATAVLYSCAMGVYISLYNSVYSADRYERYGYMIQTRTERCGHINI